MAVVSGLLGIVLVLSLPATVVGAITALIVRSSGGNPVKGFWISFIITVALEILLVGLCLAAFSNAYGLR